MINDINLYACGMLQMVSTIINDIFHNWTIPTLYVNF